MVGSLNLHLSIFPHEPGLYEVPAAGQPPTLRLRDDFALPVALPSHGCVGEVRAMTPPRPRAPGSDRPLGLRVESKRSETRNSQLGQRAGAVFHH